MNPIEATIFNDTYDPIQYRLGNAVLIKNKAVLQILENEGIENTLAYRYLSESARREEYLSVSEFADQVENFTKEQDYDLPLEDELVIHLRAGDRNHYLKSTEKLINTIKEITDNNKIKTITIVTALHFHRHRIHNPKKYFKIMNQYVNSMLYYYTFIGKILEEIPNTEINIRSTNNVDSDFCYLCNAKFLIVTDGTFSLLAYVCNRAGTKINFKFKNPEKKTARATSSPQISIDEVIEKFNELGITY